MSHPAREFAPLRPTSRWRIPLGILLTLASLAPVVLLVLLVGFRPSIVYRIEAGRLEVSGGTGPLASHRTIPLASVKEVTEVTLGRGRRVAGTGIPGLCAGRFSYDGLGSVWQVTDCRRDVLLLRLDGLERPVLLTPPDRAAFRAALRAGRDGDFSPPPAPQPMPWRLVMWFALAATVPAMVYVAAAFLLAPGRLRYRVAAFELEVQLLAWTRRLPLAGCSARRHTPRRGVWKLAGTALPGYCAGLFRVDGASTRVYATTTRAEGVLIEGATRIFVTPADLSGFLAALHAQGVRVEE